MPVYVDNERIPYGRMLMCHMVADTEEELHAMADAIGVQRKWYQYPGSAKAHYDVCTSKREKAIDRGAIEIGREQLVAIIRRKREAMAQEKPA